MTETAIIDWFGKWGTSVFSENTAIFSDMFHPNTDVKANLKLFTITELRSILHTRTQTFEKEGGVRIYMFYLIMLHCFPYYLKQ